MNVGLFDYFYLSLLPSPFFRSIESKDLHNIVSVTISIVDPEMNGFNPNTYHSVFIPPLETSGGLLPPLNSFLDIKEYVYQEWLNLSML